MMPMNEPMTPSQSAALREDRAACLSDLLEAARGIDRTWHNVESGITKGAGGVWTASNPTRLDAVVISVELLEPLREALQAYKHQP